ncbi:MAG TPA: hypothetical protein VMH37_12915 [Candidatus Binataceae bacterium]|nr:hypothetical protein [Candidatus Binataceae bacterium]
MTQYASLEALLAHRQALARGPRTPVLDQIDETIRSILGEASRLVVEEPADSAARRHRDRAESKLRRELIARGVITG